MRLVAQSLKFQRSDKSILGLLDYEADHHRRDWEASHSILVAWQVSFNDIQRTHPKAASLLSLMSFFDRQGIPEELLRHTPMGKSPTGHLFAVGRTLFRRWKENLDTPYLEHFETNVRVLRDYSLICLGIDQKSFVLHWLVRLATRNWLEVNGQIERWSHQSLQILSDKLYDRQPITLSYLKTEPSHAIYRHIRSAISYRPSSKGPLRQWAILCRVACEIAYRYGDFTNMTHWATQSMEILEAISSPDDLELLNSVLFAANVLRIFGRSKDREALLIRDFKAFEWALGPNHPHFVTIQYKLAKAMRYFFLYMVTRVIFWILHADRELQS
ncbi:kinesin [Penicillium odoratum]|uniref:kinesin n=1 Tax=Penicillium odoratum TaxID=1167516 RepID=UPI00254877AC|nr:kinesin [Penicillium odoratum]KAJ5771866.1 kinesin [Penicillium odoratum]